jgi:hypothetical protein
LRCIGGESLSVRELLRVVALRGRMFPNVRFMIAAVVASIVALGGGFAVFASFRVNHEPLSRLAGGTPPLQLAADSPAQSAATGESFGTRLQVIQAQPAGAVQTVPAPANDAVPADDAVPVAAAEPEPGAPETPEQGAPVAQAPADEPAAPDTKRDDVAVAPDEPANEQTSEPTNEPQNQSPPATTDTAVVDQPSEPVAPTEPKTTAAEPASPPAATDADVPPAESAPPAEQLPSQQPPAQQADQTAKPDPVTPPVTPPAVTKPTAAPPKAAAPSPPEHRKVVRHTRLAARPRPAAVPNSQPSGIGGPFVPAPNFAPPTSFGSPPAQVSVRTRKAIAATPNTF